MNCVALLWAGLSCIDTLAAIQSWCSDTLELENLKVCVNASNIANVLLIFLSFSCFPCSDVSLVGGIEQWRVQSRGGAGAEVTGGNWCDEHVWPPPPLPPAPPPPPHMCHKHGTPPCTTGMCGKCVEQSRLWCPAVATICRVTNGVEWASTNCSADKQYVRRSPSLYKTSLSFMKHETPHPTQRLPTENSEAL